MSAVRRSFLGVPAGVEFELFHQRLRQSHDRIEELLLVNHPETVGFGNVDQPLSLEPTQLDGHVLPLHAQLRSDGVDVLDAIKRKIDLHSSAARAYSTTP